MQTVMTPCRVPWMPSASTSRATLTHTETDVSPECAVVFDGCGIRKDLKFESHRIEIVFYDCWFTRTGPKPDTAGIESLGYRRDPPTQPTTWEQHLEESREWLRTGICSYPGFYVALQSGWLASLPKQYQKDKYHYVLVARDGYIELAATGFHWKQRRWPGPQSTPRPKLGRLVAQGKGSR